VDPWNYLRAVIFAAAFVAFAATIVIPVVLSNDGGNQNQLILNNLSSQALAGHLHALSQRQWSGLIKSVTRAKNR